LSPYTPFLYPYKVNYIPVQGDSVPNRNWLSLFIQFRDQTFFWGDFRAYRLEESWFGVKVCFFLSICKGCGFPLLQKFWIRFVPQSLLYKDNIRKEDKKR